MNIDLDTPAHDLCEIFAKLHGLSDEALEELQILIDIIYIRASRDVNNTMLKALQGMSNNRP